jgi:hypothetical protein
MLAPACRNIIDSNASEKKAGSNVPATAQPAAEPTRTGAALATKNFGLEARNRITNFECPKRDFIDIGINIIEDKKDLRMTDCIFKDSKVNDSCSADRKGIL